MEFCRSYGIRPIICCQCSLILHLGYLRKCYSLTNILVLNAITNADVSMDLHFILTAILGLLLHAKARNIYRLLAGNRPIA